MDSLSCPAGTGMWHIKTSSVDPEQRFPFLPVYQWVLEDKEMCTENKAII